MQAIIFTGIQASGKTTFYLKNFFDTHVHISLDKLNTRHKEQLLFQNGLNFNELPTWQKRGMGLYWSEVEKEGFNPIKNEKTLVTRREIVVDYDLPMRDEYDTFIEKLVNKNS